MRFNFRNFLVALTMVSAVMIGQAWLSSNQRAPAWTAYTIEDTEVADVRKEIKDATDEFRLLTLGRFAPPVLGEDLDKYSFSLSDGGDHLWDVVHGNLSPLLYKLGTTPIRQRKFTGAEIVRVVGRLRTVLATIPTDEFNENESVKRMTAALDAVVKLRGVR